MLSHQLGKGNEENSKPSFRSDPGDITNSLKPFIYPKLKDNELSTKFCGGVPLHLQAPPPPTPKQVSSLPSAVQVEEARALGEQNRYPTWESAQMQTGQPGLVGLPVMVARPARGLDYM